MQIFPWCEGGIRSAQFILFCPLILRSVQYNNYFGLSLVDCQSILAKASSPHTLQVAFRAMFDKCDFWLVVLVQCVIACNKEYTLYITPVKNPFLLC